MDFVYNLWIYVILPFLISFFAAWVFWILTFKYSNIDIVFSDKLEKREREGNNGEKNFMYRIRLFNIGSRDLIEVSFIAKVKIKMENGRNYVTYFPVGDECVNPVILRRKTEREVKKTKDSDFVGNLFKNYKLHYYGLYVNDIAYKEFAKEEYVDSIRKKASDRVLLLNDIFETYPGAEMVIYMFGNDSITGARRKFESKTYCKNDIVEGNFRRVYENEMLDRYKRLRMKGRKKKKEFLEEMLSLVDAR